MTETPARHLRIPADVWAATGERAVRDGTTATGVTVAALRAYLTGSAPRPQVSRPRQGAAEAPVRAGEDQRCPHPSARVLKGLCGRCGVNVSR